MSKLLTIEEIKAQYPDQWVLVGNPVMDAQGQQVLAGLPAFFSKSKKEVCYLGAELVKTFDTTFLLFTGQPRHSKRVISTVFNNGLALTDFSFSKSKKNLQNFKGSFSDTVIDERRTDL